MPVRSAPTSLPGNGQRRCAQFLWLVASFSLLTACSDTDDHHDVELGDTSTGDIGTNTEPENGEVSVVIPFAATVGEASLVCGQIYEGLGLASSRAEFAELSLYVHGIELQNSAGQWVPLRVRDDGQWQRDGVVLLDFLDQASAACASQGTAETNAMVSGFLPEGIYSNIRFALGVPASHNHLNASLAVAPFNRQRMWWSWAAGFRYLKADLRTSTTHPDGSIEDKPVYYAHSGGSRCSQDPATGQYACLDPRVSTIELPLQLGQQGVVVDAARLFSRDDLSEGRGCMGDSDLTDPAEDPAVPVSSCASQYLSMGLDTTGDVATSTGAQDFFPSVDWVGDFPVPQELPSISEINNAAGHRNPEFWPRSDYQRPPALDLQVNSDSGLSRSHAPGDPRYGEQCLKCHQSFGPGLGQFVFGGSLYREDGSPFGEGWVEIVTAQGMASWGADDPAEKLPDPLVHMRIPVDANGQFYATRDFVDQFAVNNSVPALDYSTQSYQAYVLNRDGERIMAMSPKKTGSCNQCHTGGFRITIPARLESGPWTPAP